MKTESLYYRRRSKGDDWEPVDRAEYARCVQCIDVIGYACSEGAAVAEVERRPVPEQSAKST